MKKIFSILTICAAVFASCSKVEINTPGEDGLTVTLKMAGIDTKAVVPMPGVAELNENAVKAINYYIFDGGKLVDSGAQTVADEMTSEGITVKLNGFTEEKFAEVFGADKKSLSIYVVANATSQLSGKTIESVSDIEAVALELATTAKQDSFVMVGNASIQEVDSDTDTRKATASVDLKRVVAKISLKIDLATSYQKADGEPVWTPESSQINVSFRNLAKNGVISGMADEVVLVDAEAKNFTAGAEVAGYYPCTTAEPYYSYPRTWALGDETQPYFLINIPWTANGETKQTYYKVILSNKSFASNNWYAIDVKLDGLGSLTPGEPVVVEPLDLTVADWTASVSGTYEYHTEATFTEARVLDIPQSSVTLFNQNNASFSFYSTHDCVIKSVVQHKIDYSKSSMPSSDVTLTDFSGLVSISDRTLVFTNELHNNINNTPFDYCNLVYTVRICHVDDESFYDEITITQVPALSISATANSSGDTGATTFVNGKGGYTDNDSHNVGFGTLVGNVSKASNSNPNMYVVSVATLDNYKLTDGETLAIVGDPRKSSIDNVGLTGTSAASATSVQGSNRRLQAYYPVDPTKNNVIAPKIRVASSHGATQNLSKENALKRCATYQEDGYPAGRWRVPTRAEVEFISTLSNKGLITRLFGSSSGSTNYWCAEGYITVGGTSVVYHPGAANEVYVRCVYDEWYWENSAYPTVAVKTFTWGDMER